MNATKLSASCFLFFELKEGQITIFSGTEFLRKLRQKYDFNLKDVFLKKLTCEQVCEEVK